MFNYRLNSGILKINLRKIKYGLLKKSAAPNYSLHHFYLRFPVFIGK